ncbi:MAG: hypothetical protein VW262_01640 [Flavobacteriaceae bacterium]
MRIVVIYLMILFMTPAFAILNGFVENNIVLQTEKKIVYQEGYLYIQGFIGSGKIEVYSIIGNKITEEKVYDFSQFSFQIDLASRNLYVVRVTSNGNIHTFKIIA